MRRLIIFLLIGFILLAASASAVSDPDKVLGGMDAYITTRVLTENLYKKYQIGDNYWQSTFETGFFSAVVVAAPLGIMVGATEDNDDWFYGVAISFGADIILHGIYYILIKEEVLP